MTLAPLADQLAGQYPDARDGCEQIKRFDRAASALPWHPFYEPVSVIEQDEKGRGRHLNVDAPMLQAWAKHMSYSMRLRMRSFEPTILRELLSGTSLAASTGLRAHLEAAAMASLCVLRLNEARTSGGLTKLATLIPQTLFGTALAKKAKRDERVLEMLSFAE